MRPLAMPLSACGLDSWDMVRVTLDVEGFVGARLRPELGKAALELLQNPDTGYEARLVALDALVADLLREVRERPSP